MNEPVNLTGIILSVAPQGEYDRRVVLLTKERGKISAFARGARRSSSALLAATNVFVTGTFTLYEGRNSYTMTHANIRNYFTELAKAQPEVYYGFYFLELASYFGREGLEEPAMINLLYLSLKALLNEKLNNQLVRVIFELKTMVINGEYPQAAEIKNISPSALYTLQYIISSPLEKLYTFAVTPEVLSEIKAIMKKYRELYIEKSFKTLEILEMMC